METIYDWVTVAMFGGLIVLFLHRSTSAAPKDHVILYLPACVGLAVANYLGNKGQNAFAIVLLVVVVGYVVHILKPFDLKP